MTRFWLGMALVPCVSVFAAPPAWIARSDEFSKPLLQLLAKQSPEAAGQLGVAGVDNAISDFTLAGRDRNRKELLEIQAKYARMKVEGNDPQVERDLAILRRAIAEQIRSQELSDQYRLTYVNLPRLMFGGLRVLLDDQVAPERRASALVRLRKYTGMEPGTRPVSEVLMERWRTEAKNAKLLGPYKGQIEQDLVESKPLIDGVGSLFQKYNISGADEPMKKLREQVAAYEQFARTEVMARARTDHRLPEELYADSLKNFGVGAKPEELAAKARAAFQALQNDMQATAAVVAKEKGFPSSDYRAVIRELKKTQIPSDAILGHYHDRLGQIEGIIRREQLVTLPKREARIRLASPAESAASPAPNMRPPRLVGNQGEMGEFVLPLAIRDASGKTLAYDDFSFDAMSWTLTAHEARPGHEMQFASMVETGVSTARGVFAFNSANVEGWGLYAEWLMLPYMPADGKLASLQSRLMRAARAFIDPELNLGKMTPAEASRILREDVGLSEGMTKQEVDRYMFRAPGQATSYFYGYDLLLALRKDVETRMGARFNQRAFHDFVLAQGLLPLDLLRDVVLKEFAAKP